MRLMAVLMRSGRIPGKVNMGKHQQPHYIGPRQREAFVKRLKIELANEMWLTRPYLSQEEEEKLPNGTRFTAAEVRWKETKDKQPQDEVYEYHNLRYRINMPPNVTLEERWEPLHTEARWGDIKKSDVPINRFEHYSEMARTKKIPERWPKALEKWDQWSKVKGIKPNPLKE